jgi:tRNA nucleotidyltransferase (CCA-adding enzyme)
LIHELSLYDAVFAVPRDIKAAFSETPAPSERALASASILHALLNDIDSDLPPLHPSLFEAIKTDASSVPRLYLASMLTPFANATYVDKKNKLQPATAVVIRESLKLGTQNHYLDGIPPLFASHRLLRDTLVDPRRQESPSPRLAIGRPFPR